MRIAGRIFGVSLLCVELAWLLGFLAFSLKPRQDLSCAVIHESKTMGCPRGYTREADPRFTEKDGSKQFACVASVQKPPCIDVLEPGESVKFTIQLPMPANAKSDDSPARKL